MKFSVLIPLYNGARFIGATLDSVVRQTYKNYEIVLVNDGSPDNVGEVVKNYISSHPRVKIIYIEQENKGLGGARNSAIKYATGEIMALLDQDDIWYPEKLERVAKAYKDDPEVSIVCHRQYIRGKNGIINVTAEMSYENEMHRTLLFNRGNFMTTSGTTFKKSVIERVGCFSEDIKNLHFLEDYDLWLKMARAGYKFCFLSEVLGEYVRHSSNNFSDITLICNSELYVLNLHYGLLEKKMILDWYRIRRRRAVLFFYTAQRSLLEAYAPLKMFIYLFRTLISDPFFIFTLIMRTVKKTRLLMLEKGAIR
jgi:glycosyltransferase involved in cell wall biosynthesis